MRIVSLDDYVAVYNPLSGNTHLLDAVTGALLAAIAAGKADEESLRGVAEGLVDYPDDATAREEVAFMISALADLALIEAVPC